MPKRSRGASPDGTAPESQRDADDLLVAAQRDAEPEGAAAEEGGTERVAGWSRVLRGNRTLWIVAGVAVLCLVAGVLVGRFIVSPADAAASAGAPDPGLITVPVEFGTLSNDVTIRADVGYVDPVEVTLDTSTLSGPAVVTGQVPERGAELRPLSIALEVAGRPVIVLPGELPAYRTLRVGVSGPDVLQFKQALAEVGIDAGDVGSDVFDASTASAVEALYVAAGYPPPAAEEGAADQVRSAEEGVRFAAEAVASAEGELNRAGAGPSAVEIRQADNAVSGAQRALDAELAAPTPDPVQVGDLRDQLELAKLQRAQLDAAPDTSAQWAALNSARQQHQDARDMLAEARTAALPSLPASEILYLTEFPRRVDDVAVRRGAILSGPAMTVSGATVQLSAAAAEADARLLEVGGEAVMQLPDGTTHRAVIASVGPGEGSSGRWSIELTPDPFTPEQLSLVQGQNLRVGIPVGSTQGEVLSVPFAALTAGPGGESRVEVVVGDPRDGEDAETRLVEVETGLAAAGYVEVTPVDGELAEGDLVVVGR